MKLNIMVLGMLLLLSLTVVSAQAVTQQVTSQLWVRNTDNNITVSMLVFTANQPSSAISDAQARYNRMVTSCQGSLDFNQCSFQTQSANLASNAQYPVSFSSVQNANFTFMYWNPFRQGGAGWSTVPGCDKVTANQPGTIVNTTGGQIPLWSGTCMVDKKIYSGRTIQIRVLSSAGDQMIAPVQSVTLTDANASAAAIFSSALTNALAPVTTALSIQGQGQTVPCLGVFIILGLLLASMYFSGKSPITMLDITTPRLPSPKGLTAGGQIIAPFGYGEMKGTVNKKTAAAAAIAKGVWDANQGKASAAATKEITRLASQVPNSQDAAMFKAMALSYVQGGGKISELKKLAKPFTEYSKEDNASLRQILAKLEKSPDGNIRWLAKSAIDLRQSRDVLETLDVLTHKPTTGIGRVMQKGMGKLYGGDNLKITGPLFTGSYGAGVRSLGILARSTKATVVHGAEFVRATGKLTVQTVGGQGAMDALKEKAKTSTTYATLYNQLNRKPGQMKLGEIMPINQKSAHQANVYLKELAQDQNRHLIKRIYKQLGVNIAAMTDNDMFAMTHKVVDPLKITGYTHSGRMAAAESEIYSILSSGSLSAFEKRDRLENLLQSLGGRPDASYMNMKAQVDRIHKDPAESHIKLLMVQELFDRENSAHRGARQGEAMLDDQYHCLVGRNNGLHGSDLAEVAIIRKQMADIEGGKATKDVSIRDFMNALRVELENKVNTLNPALIGADLLPEFMRDSGVRQQKSEANRKLLASLITDEGEKALRELTGKNKSNATINDFMHVLYGNEYMAHKQGLKVDGESGVHYDPKTGKSLWLEDASVIGPMAGWWKTDMKQHWVEVDRNKFPGGIDTRNLQLTVGTAIQAKAERSFGGMVNHAISAELDRYPGAKSWTPEQRLHETKKAWVRDLFEKDVHNTFNDRFAMNAYGNTTNETSRYLTNVSAAMLAKALREAGYEERHTDLRFLDAMDINNPKDMARFREMIGVRYKKEYEEVLKKGVTVDDISKSTHPWIMTHEGTYVPYRPGQPVSDNDRVLGGITAIHDGKFWRAFNPEDVQVQFKGRDDMAMALNRVAGSADKEAWAPFINQMMEWARPGGKGGDYEKEKVVGAVLWKYANATYDYQSYWNKSGVRLVPKHEATPLAPSILRSFGVEAPGLTKTLKPLRDFSQLAGELLVKSALSGTGDLYLRSYDVTPKSQLLKMYSWRLSTEILTSDMNEILKDVTSESDRRNLASAYRSMAIAHGAFHQVWAYTIDRNPWRNSTSHGAHQAWASAFQYGPAMTYSMKANLGSYMSKGEFFSFMMQGGWAAELGRKAIMPYQKMIAGPQRSLQGYTSAHDWNAQDALRAYGDHTPPRLLEAVRGYNPLSVSQGNGMLSRMLQKANVYESRAEKAQLSGYDHSKGLMQGYAGIQTVYKGPAAIARTGMANPAASYMDTRFNEQLAPSMAEYAVMSMGPMSGFYQQDDYVQKMAMTDIVRRTVSAEALAIRRQQELMSFGVLQNPLYTFFNPVLFAYHMGVPGFPNTLSPKELINSFVNKWRRGDSSGNLEQSMKSVMRKTQDGLTRAFSPQMASLQKYCKCGKPGHTGTMCQCGTQL